MRDEHFAAFEGSDGEAGRRSQVLAILVKLALELVNDGPPQKRARIICKPHAGVKCFAILGVILGKRSLKHYCQRFGDLSSDKKMRADSGETGAAVADIAGNKKSLLTHFSESKRDNDLTLPHSLGLVVSIHGTAVPPRPFRPCPGCG